MSLIYWERELEQPTVPFDVHFLLKVTKKRTTTKICVNEKKVSRLMTRQVQQQKEVSLPTSLCSPSPAPFSRSPTPEYGLPPFHNLGLVVTIIEQITLQVQLFGGWSNDEVPIVVTDVTFRAFRALVDYIYGKPLDRAFFDVLGLEAAVRVLELAYAAEKYQVEVFLCI